MLDFILDELSSETKYIEEESQDSGLLRSKNI